MNPRYVRYAQIHGNTPEAQLEADKVRFPGGCMCGFMLWVQGAWRAFSVLNGCSDFTQAELRLGVKECHRRFDEFLSGYEVQYR